MRRLGIALGAPVFAVLTACSTQGVRDGDAPQRGLASWYGKAFHGRKTASGERFDMHSLSAAHRTLRFGTNVRVRSLASGKSVVVRINDRGPYSKGRIIDLSYEAARQLGFVTRGEEEVEIQPLR